MIIKLTEKQMSALTDEEDLIVDGETFEYVDGNEREDEHGRYKNLIYKQPSTSKYFKVKLFYCRYGYKDYSYESYMQVNEAVEVERIETVNIMWRIVKDSSYTIPTPSVPKGSK